jgi:plasmid stabilization system protein ParE
MNRRLIIRPEAEADLTDAAVWYDSRETGLGLELLSEVDSAIARALKNPESFTRVRRNPTIRRVLTRRFPYRVFFIVRPDAIVVFAVLHAARHDRVWKHRAEHKKYLRM